jgi:hypothetical protein
MAGNRFGFPFEGNTQTANTDLNGVFLTASGSETVVLVPNAACKVSMPNPATCEGQTRTVVNLTANIITLVQYNASAPTTHGSTIVQALGAISMTADPFRTEFDGAQISRALSASTAKNVYNSFTMYCDGTDWEVIDGDINPRA